MLSVVVPIRGRPEPLELQLEALLRQETPRGLEVIVADNSMQGDSSVTDLVRSMSPEADLLRLVPAPDRSGAAYARNVGAAAAAGEKLAFVDADDVVADDWAASISNALEARPVVASSLEYERLNSEKVRGSRGPLQTTGPIPYRRPPFLSHVSASGLAMRRAVFDEMGGFDESYSHLEDTDLSWRLQLAGYELHVERDAVVHYRLRSTVRASFWQAYDYGKAHGQLQRDYLKHGIPRLGPMSMLRTVLNVVRGSPALLDPTRRARYLRVLGNRLGRIAGSIKYGVWAA